MTSYHDQSILLNGRQISFDEIRSSAVQTSSEFEFASIAFLKEWLEGANTFIQKTSGSTGTPKEIVITRAQMIASAKATEKALDLKKGATALICLDTRFIAGKMMCVRSLVTGMQMILQEPAANPLANLPLQARVDFVALVPYQIEEILGSAQRHRLNSLGTVIIGGAPLREETTEQLAAFTSRFFLTYGMTESMSHIALQRLGIGATGAFECLEGVTVETDERGCLVANVPWLREKLFTNDLIDIISSKNFRWLGRYDNIINTGGFKANPEKIEFQIEKVFKSLNVDRRFFVAGIANEKTGEQVTLLIEGEEVPGLIAKLQHRLKPIVQRFEIPKAVYFIDKFEYTHSNKLDRSGTLERLRSRVRF
jgi:O-succinylbenzoic acid--CoA ligase